MNSNKSEGKACLNSVRIIKDLLKPFCPQWVKSLVKQGKLTSRNEKEYDVPKDVRNRGVKKIGTFDWTYDDFRQMLKEFAILYSQRPIENNKGGMNSSHMFYCWFVAKKLNPEFIIESGVWKGQSTWLFETAAPQAKIISIDPHLEFREYISEKVQYRTEDFSSTTDWGDVIKTRTLVFFDDHYGVDRIKQCSKLGFKHILYEDNYPMPGGNQHHPSGDALSVKATFYANNEDAVALENMINLEHK